MTQKTGDVCTWVKNENKNKNKTKNHNPKVEARRDSGAGNFANLFSDISDEEEDDEDDEEEEDEEDGIDEEEEAASHSHRPNPLANPGTALDGKQVRRMGTLVGKTASGAGVKASAGLHTSTPSERFLALGVLRVNCWPGLYERGASRDTNRG